MIFRIISLALTALLGAGAIIYIIHLIQTGAVQKEQLAKLNANYNQLLMLQEREHTAMLKRDQVYAKARKAQEIELDKLQAALSRASVNDECVNKRLPDRVLTELRDTSGSLPGASGKPLNNN